MYKTSDGLEGYIPFGDEYSSNPDVFLCSRMRTVSRKVIVYTLGQSSLYMRGIARCTKRRAETGLATWCITSLSSCTVRWADSPRSAVALATLFLVRPFYFALFHKRLTFLQWYLQPNTGAFERPASITLNAKLE
jgi:hypothetical protein